MDHRSKGRRRRSVIICAECLDRSYDDLGSISSAAVESRFKGTEVIAAPLTVVFPRELHESAFNLEIK